MAVAEECQVCRECGACTRTYGSRFIEIEYTDNGRSAVALACAAQAVPARAGVDPAARP